MSIKHNGTDEMVDKGYAWMFIPSAGNGLICAKVPAGFVYGHLYANTIVPMAMEKSATTKATVLSMNHHPELIDHVDAIIELAEKKIREAK